MLPRQSCASNPWTLSKVAFTLSDVPEVMVMLMVMSYRAKEIRLLDGGEWCSIKWTMTAAGTLCMRCRRCSMLHDIDILDEGHQNDIKGKISILLMVCGQDGRLA